MAITPDWATLTFTVPQADLTLVSGTLYEMDTEVDFRQKINAIMDDEDGIVFEDPISHNTPVTVAGTTFARTIEMINGYSITFTPDSQWSVRYAGSNNNLFDVENGILNQNQVQVISANSGGLIESGISGLTASESTKLNEMWQDHALDSANPKTYTQTQETVGTVTKTVTGDPAVSTTVTRNP